MKFKPLHPDTVQALDKVHDWNWMTLDDPEITAWRHGSAVDYRISNLIRHIKVCEDPFKTVCAIAGLKMDESFFKQVAHCLALENKPHQIDRPVSDRVVTLAYESAVKKMQVEPMKKRMIIREWIPSASAVAKEIDLRMGTAGTTAAAVVDLCTRKNLALKIQKHGTVGRPKKEPIDK